MTNKFFILFLFVSVSLFAQDKKSLEERANKMYEYTASQQYEKLLDYTYPKLFTLIPKEKMVEALRGMTKGEGFTITIAPPPANFKFGEIKKIDDAHYCVLTHNLSMKMTFTEPVGDEELKLLLPSFKEAMKTDNVTFDKKDNSFTIIKASQAIAVFDKLSNNQWTFVNNTEGPIKGMLFSERVIKELGL